VRRFRVWIAAAILGPVIAGLLVVFLTPGVDRAGHALFDSGPPPPFSVEATLGPPPNMDLCGGTGVTSWVFSQPATKLEPPSRGDMSDPALLAGWAAKAGGVPKAGSSLSMTITATGQDSVVLKAMRVAVVKRGPLLHGTLGYPAGGCGGGVLTPKYFSVDLDRDPPGPVIPKAGNTGPPDNKVIPPEHFPLTVSGSSPEQLYMELDTSACTCDVYVLLDWQAGNVNGTLAIKHDSHNAPFRVAAVQGSKATLIRNPDTGEWYPPYTLPR
jgi:hypothetical protein